MEILYKSIHLIDLDNNICMSIKCAEGMDGYFDQLITYVTKLETGRNYRSRKPDAAVVAGAKEISKNTGDQELFEKHSEASAGRLLAMEQRAQSKIDRLGARVQRGSLVQALVSVEGQSNLRYVLAKVEHIDFVDDLDFSTKSGFDMDYEKKIWKTCVLNLSSTEEKTPAFICSDTDAKYWYADFLEMEECNANAVNTKNAYEAIEKLLKKRKLREKSVYDCMILQNAITCRFMKDEQLDYENMIVDIFDRYKPVKLSADDMQSLRNDLRALPGDRFDKQFTPDQEYMKTKIKNTYDITEGIQLQIRGGIDDLEQVISSEETTDGTIFLKIKTSQRNVDLMPLKKKV